MAARVTVDELDCHYVGEAGVRRQPICGRGGLAQRELDLGVDAMQLVVGPFAQARRVWLDQPDQEDLAFRHRTSPLKLRW
jgi:hypothetical protein